MNIEIKLEYNNYHLVYITIIIHWEQMSMIFDLYSCFFPMIITCFPAQWFLYLKQDLWSNSFPLSLSVCVAVTYWLWIICGHWNEHQQAVKPIKYWITKKAKEHNDSLDRVENTMDHLLLLIAYCLFSFSLRSFSWLAGNELNWNTNSHHACAAVSRWYHLSLPDLWLCCVLWCPRINHVSITPVITSITTKNL